ncbi:Uncharacterised protein [Acinetobacter baumannii]|nr:Uncharacterised protein [Acinetobacter baumannii]
MPYLNISYISRRVTVLLGKMANVLITKLLSKQALHRWEVDWVKY